MAKKSVNRLSDNSNTESSSLQMSLFAPGMSLMHRAGLGGLACSLRWIERQYEQGTVSDEQVPGGPWLDGNPPWAIEPDSVRLRFDASTGAAEFLKRLFALSFQITSPEGLIYLPGQFDGKPDAGLLAEIQNGLTMTFIQHGKTRTLAKEAVARNWDASAGDGRQIQVQFKPCSWFKHQDGWESLIDKSGRVTKKQVEVIGPLSPGAVVRHVAFTSSTKIEDPVERALPLYFAIIGCLVLSVNRGSGVLIIPEVEDLDAFTFIRPELNPASPRDCRIASASDAALQAQVRLWSSGKLKATGVPSCSAILFQPTSWASQQKSRVNAISVASTDIAQLRVFQTALAHLRPRMATTVANKPKPKAGKAAKKKAVRKTPAASDDAPTYFWSDSIIRPLIADNLARGQPWYRGFVDLMTKLDPVSKKPKRLKLFFEKEGLKAMTENVAWRDEGESAVVRAVHEAMRCRLGAIAAENKTNKAARQKRTQGEFDKWRLAFSGAKTIEQFRKALCDLVSRAGSNKVLRENWELVLPWISSQSHWQLTRDLSLLALASYSGKGADEITVEAVSEIATNVPQED